MYQKYSDSILTFTSFISMWRGVNGNEMIKLHLRTTQDEVVIGSFQSNRAKHTNTWGLARELKVISHCMCMKPKDRFQLQSTTNKDNSFTLL